MLTRGHAFGLTHSSFPCIPRTPSSATGKGKGKAAGKGKAKEDTKYEYTKGVELPTVNCGKRFNMWGVVTFIQGSKPTRGTDYNMMLRVRCVAD